MVSRLISICTAILSGLTSGFQAVRLKDIFESERDGNFAFEIIRALMDEVIPEPG
jgi:hypothetical protein